MKLNQKMMSLHITIVVLNLFVEIFVFGIESRLAPKGKPGAYAATQIVLFTCFDFIQMIIVILFLKLATPSPKLMVKDSFISSEQDEPIKGYDVHYYSRDGKQNIPKMTRISEEI